MHASFEYHYTLLYANCLAKNIQLKVDCITTGRYAKLEENRGGEEVLLLIVVMVVSAILLRAAVHERRTLWFGALAVIWLGTVYGAVFIWLFQTSEGVVNPFLLAILLLPFAVTALAPLIAIGILLINGIKIIRREGFRLAHCLALASGIGAILYTVAWPLLINVTEDTVANHIFYYISSCLLYFLFTFLMYFFATIANFINLPQRKLDYVIVLGAGLMGDQVTPLLASRIEKAMKIFAKQQESCQIIMSGGQGDDELVSEAEAMAQYAIERGIDSQRIILENRAVNTYENIECSYALMTKKEPRVAIVTNYYHLFRALVIAKQQGYACIGYGARTKFYYTVNAYLREYIGYLSLTLRRHLFICGILLLVRLFIMLI